MPRINTPTDNELKACNKIPGEGMYGYAPMVELVTPTSQLMEVQANPAKIHYTRLFVFS